MATITTDDVKHVANLARLEFSEEETQQFTHQLARILDYIGKLNELDTTDVPPTSHVLPIRNVVKEDVAEPSYDRDLVLATAPAAEEGHFEVPQVIE
ncbi:MAG: Asp-tRNA(Asn)/Glu-tRNA(Gln) amidotransferase subunit GatC [Candidatus Poribacteria bacterium]|nr:Asp-tRNA(Asn)/Glu-tRNA(Gln) amidotransferase subunit GatC [Candidatus Poribacteria bacterium]